MVNLEWELPNPTLRVNSWWPQWVMVHLSTTACYARPAGLDVNPLRFGPPQPASASCGSPALCDAGNRRWAGCGVDIGAVHQTVHFESEGVD
jgi:hypothetical protein